ncbi:MAG TPA: acetyl CoA synthetase subunit alpha [Cyanobacteria bacterium UBA11149]|nr:acetyl CoA synthetase subunit alpha [Cyanobacteria bacterium UBA11367]HBE57158.1 acetyl CoA synthetase subunit alpha [Cyanobacteria bacterium UBA11366]HBR72849.1 acetyl CoA synthetase subunit alpha [Cyanobacteria bacterium UBA11159]HBS67813.1 acetyl CoA synthetase subunit alpha [Cyanobacteria bacterium UBA11153]HBW91569.1 acetyl CoA synthetase subunit alpha [Cyanobacteria bacterium UBA11149]HCA93326.1 acetyl CoA synthetase subunit alpha [Cyanobacteria bacterium UBA9226]
MLKPHLKPTTDPAYDILRAENQPLSTFFSPETVAVIGATDKQGSVGRTLLWNLMSNPFGGTIFPINPKRNNVLGIPAYPNIKAVPQPVDLAIIAIPAPSVPGIIDECVEAGVKSAIIISAGFKEIGAAGVELERQILEKARGKMRVIGPNCLGLMCPLTGLNATFASTMARPGNVAFISQSGALCTAVLDWSFWENVGFSAFMSIGSMLDVGWGDLIYYLGDDPHTHSIVIYMESVGDARSFLSAAREVALTKPIIVIKVGRTEAAAKAASSHTGSLAGSDDVLDAAFRRCGVLRVNRISELFNMAEVLAKQPRLPKGPRMTIITNAGGPGVLATDALITSGSELAELAPETITELNKILPPHWSHSNPIDILGDADPERYTKSLEIAIKDPNSDGLLVILTPQAMTDPTQTAEQLKSYAQNATKPVFASWMGGSETKAGETLLNRASIPTYPYPDSAARLFNLMWQYSYNLKGIYETPILPSDAETGPDRALAQKMIETARNEGRTILTELESKQLLAAYNIPIVHTGVATTEAEAVNWANSLGYPVVLKLFSETITHKTDVGGVQLNIADEESVKWAYRRIKESVSEKVGAEHFLGVTVQQMIRLDGGYELIIGSSIDPQFGPVLVFGSGGQLVEVFKDSAIALPPLNTTLALRMMENTTIYKALKGVRGRKPVDLVELEQVLVRFSQLVIEQRWIKEIDINPLLASSERLIALDARIILHDPDITETQLPKPAIRPYPTQYITSWTMTDGTPVTIRPIRPEDEPLIGEFHATLSEQSVYFRYFSLMKLSRRIAHERLTRICFIDYDREMALVADYKDPETGKHQILAAGRLSKLHGVNEGEFAMLVSDSFQRRGIGSELLRRLVQIGRDEKLERINADILAENLPMQKVSEKVGFRLHRASTDLVKAVIDL